MLCAPRVPFNSFLDPDTRASSVAGARPARSHHCNRAPEGMNLPGFRLHELKGARKGLYAVSVSGNWRVTFRFEDASAVDVDCVDYH